MKEAKELEELFTTERKCDFCQKTNRIIVNAVVHPILQVDDNNLVVTGVSIACKCIHCCEKELSEA
jgi:hypothetical protein